MTTYKVTPDARRRIRAHQKVLEISLRISDEDMSRALIDLSRSATSEMRMVGISSAYSAKSVSGYEMMLTQRIMPEIAMRLSVLPDKRKFLLDEETCDLRIGLLSGPELRKLTGLAWSKSDFPRIGAAVRAHADPYGRHNERLFATEIIGQEPCNGNILEIALSRAVQPEGIGDDRNEDLFCARIRDISQLRGFSPPHLFWSPDMQKRPGIHPDEPEPA